MPYKEIIKAKSLLGLDFLQLIFLMMIGCNLTNFLKIEVSKIDDCIQTLRYLYICHNENPICHYDFFLFFFLR